MNFTKSDSFKQELVRVYNELVMFMSYLEPCEATYSFSDGRQIVCTTERMVHGPHHRSSHKAFGPSADPSSLTRFYQNLSAWFKVGYRPIWEGGHQFTYPKAPSDDFNYFVTVMQLLSKVRILS